jgi:pyruvate formate lyase activating enzyme
MRCPWCHNKELQCGETYVRTDFIYDLMAEASEFVDAVVFSGGEPLDQIEAVFEMAFDAHTLGLLVGIHTAKPEKLPLLQGVIDYAWVSDPHIHPSQPGSHHAIWYDHGGGNG